MTWSVNQQNAVMSALIGGGVKPLGAAALVSRWSNVEDPNGLGSTFGGYMGHAFGIGQWLGSRKAALFGFADDNGTDPNSILQTQVPFALNELNGPEAASLSQLNSATDPFSAATGASMFERAGGYDPSTGTDAFTGKTADGIPSILKNWQASGGATVNPSDTSYASDSYDPNDAYVNSLGNVQPATSLGGVPLASDQGGQPDASNVTSAYDDSENIDAAIYGQAGSQVQAGDYASAGQSVARAGQVTNTNVSNAAPGIDLTQAVNEQTKQLATNTKAENETATKNTQAAIKTQTGIVASIETFVANIFERGSLIVLGAIFILVGVGALALMSIGNGSVSEGAKTAAKHAATAAELL